MVIFPPNIVQDHASQDARSRHDLQSLNQSPNRRAARWDLIRHITFAETKADAVSLLSMVVRGVADGLRKTLQFVSRSAICS